MLYIRNHLHIDPKTLLSHGTLPIILLSQYLIVLRLLVKHNLQSEQDRQRERKNVKEERGKKVLCKKENDREHATNPTFFFPDTVWIEEAIGRQGSEYFWSPTLIFRLGKISVGKVTSCQ